MQYTNMFIIFVCKVAICDFKQLSCQDAIHSIQFKSSVCCLLISLNAIIILQHPHPALPCQQTSIRTMGRSNAQEGRIPLGNAFELAVFHIHQHNPILWMSTAVLKPSFFGLTSFETMKRECLHVWVCNNKILFYLFSKKKCHIANKDNIQ